jgi:hypothetical protein
MPEDDDDRFSVMVLSPQLAAFTLILPVLVVALIVASDELASSGPGPHSGAKALLAILFSVGGPAAIAATGFALYALCYGILSRMANARCLSTGARCSDFWVLKGEALVVGVAVLIAVPTFLMTDKAASETAVKDLGWLQVSGSSPHANHLLEHVQPHETLIRRYVDLEHGAGPLHLAIEPIPGGNRRALNVYIENREVFTSDFPRARDQAKLIPQIADSLIAYLINNANSVNFLLSVLNLADYQERVQFRLSTVARTQHFRKWHKRAAVADIAIIARAAETAEYRETMRNILQLIGNSEAAKPPVTAAAQQALEALPVPESAPKTP